MNIELVKVGTDILPYPYGLEFKAGFYNSNWDIQVEDFDEWAFGEDPVTKVDFEIPGVKVVRANLERFPLGPNPTYWHANPNAYPTTEDGVMYLKALYTKSGKLRWMNPDI